jgi:hypothetical protein
MLNLLARQSSLLLPMSGAGALQLPAKQVDTQELDAAAVNWALQLALHLAPLAPLLHSKAASAGMFALLGVPKHAAVAAAAAAATAVHAQYQHVIRRAGWNTQTKRIHLMHYGVI